MHLPLFNTRALTPPKPNPLTKACALLLAATVILMAVLAVCPTAHEWFHHDADHSDHECAVTLFAHGITTALAVAALSWVAWRLIGVTVAPARTFQLPAPSRRLPPGRAPPVN